MELQLFFANDIEDQGMRGYVEKVFERRLSKFQKYIASTKMTIKNSDRYTQVSCNAKMKTGEDVTGKSCVFGCYSAIDIAVDRLARNVRALVLSGAHATRVTEYSKKMDHLVSYCADVAPYYRRVILIDDDKDFGKLFRAEALGKGVFVDYYESPDDIQDLNTIEKYDGAIVDYYLNNSNGFEVASIFNTINEKLPIVVISGSPFWLTDRNCWPNNVKAFVPKSAGLDRVVNVISDMSKH